MFALFRHSLLLWKRWRHSRSLGSGTKKKTFLWWMRAMSLRLTKITLWQSTLCKQQQ